MNVLDNVIEMYNYTWPEFNWTESDESKHAIVLIIKDYSEDGEHYKAGDVVLGGTNVDSRTCEVICTKEEFEKRAKERKNWYDYDKQEMVRLPPVGEIVFANAEDKPFKVKILEHIFDGVTNIAACRVIYDSIDLHVGRLSYYQHFCPLDWNKDEGKNKLIDKAVQIMYDNACATKGELIDGVKKLYELGYLKSPEDK